MAIATQQLTEFLSVVADRPDGPAAQHAAVECAALALDADIAVLMVDGAVVAAVGVPAEQVPAHALAEVGRRPPCHPRSADGPHAVTFARHRRPLPRRAGARPERARLHRRGGLPAPRHGPGPGTQPAGPARHRVGTPAGPGERPPGRLAAGTPAALRAAVADPAGDRPARTAADRSWTPSPPAPRELLGVEMACLNLLERDDPDGGQHGRQPRLRRRRWWPACSGCRCPRPASPGWPSWATSWSSSRTTATRRSPSRTWSAPT